MTTTYELPPVQDAAMWSMWLSMFQAPAAIAADDFHIIDTLRGRPATAAQVATELGLDARAMRVLLDLLAALGLVSFDGSAYGLTLLAETYLARESPYYWGPLLGSVKQIGFLRPLHAALQRALQRKSAPGMPAQAWAAGSIDPQLAAAVSRIMHCHSLPAAVGVALNGGFEGAQRVLDVGGGSGCFSIAIAQRHPHVRCTVMELQAVCDVAKGYIAEAGVAERVDVAVVDMFREAWPVDHDTILLSNVVHDWDRERNADLAARAFAALPRGGRICLHEMLLDDDNPSTPIAAAFSMLMLLTNEGRQYQRRELADLLASAGFSAIEARPTYGGYSLVSGVK